MTTLVSLSWKGIMKNQEIGFAFDCDASPMIPRCLTLKRHIHGGRIIWHRGQPFSLHRSELQREDLMDGYDLLREAINLPLMNACGLSFFSTHQYLIPDGVRSMCLCFWGTIFLDVHEFEYVPCLYRGKGRWYRGVRRLDDLFGEEDVAVLYPQAQSTS